jgi:hypothetical protein
VPMANVAVVSSNEEKTDHGDSLLFLRKMANGLSLLKRGFAVLRNWKIYAEFSITSLACSTWIAWVWT